MFRIAEYLTNVVRKAVQVGIDKSLDYWGIAGIKHKFIHKRDDILRFNNQNLMKSIIQNREREKQAVNSLSMDEYGLRQLFKIDEQRKYDPMMGTLLTDEDMKYLWRVFEESNYEQRKIYVKTRDVLQKAFIITNCDVQPRKDAVQGLISCLCEEDTLFPSHADLHFVPHRTWKYVRTTDIIQAQLECKQPGCTVTLDVSLRMSDLEKYKDGFIEVLCIFGGGHCIHVEGKLRKHQKEYQKENGKAINVEKPGKSVSYIRTYAKELSRHDGAGIIAGTSYAPDWSQTKYAVEQKMDCRVMSGSDVQQNVRDLQKASIHSELERMKIWRDWEQRIYDEFDETWKIILKWCWPHVTGYLVKYDDPYKHVDKKYHFMFKQLVLHFFRLFKLSLHYPVLMTCINELYCVLNTEHFEYNAPLPGNLIGLEDIVTALDNDDVYADIEGIIEQSRAKAMATAEVDRILKEMQEIEENNILNDTQDEKECADSCYWTKESGEINVRFKGRDTSNYITCDISNFKIPIIRDASKSNISRNLLYCPDLWTYLLKTIIFIPCFSSMSTGGTDKETNMQAEGVNRHFKHVEGMRNMRIDRYLSQRSIVQFEMTIYFCTRIREKNAQSMIKGSLLHDMWSGKGHVKSAESAFDLLAIDLFLKLIQYENTMDAKMGYKRLHSATMNLFKETGFAHVYSLDELSMNLFYKLKWHKSIDYKAAAFVTRQSYFILWMIYRLMARHKVSVDVMYDQYPQLEGLDIFDFKKDEDVDENMS
eukprot:190296_1